jgi:hypothetical protein
MLARETEFRNWKLDDTLPIADCRLPISYNQEKPVSYNQEKPVQVSATAPDDDQRLHYKTNRQLAIGNRQ